MNSNNIKAIALDMDGTTLNNQGEISNFNKQIIEKAIAGGVHVIVATGRAFSALPKDVFKINGIRYVISSNGANINDLKTGKVIFSSYIPGEATELILSLSKNMDIPMEVFCDGKPYIEKALYREIVNSDLNPKRRKYVIATRTPVDNLYDFTLENADKLENINLIFDDSDKKSEIEHYLRKIHNITITSSIATNIEIGGTGTSKAGALEFLLKSLDIRQCELMAMGDAANDIKMIKFAGIGVAVENAWNELKAEADYVTAANYDDGVGKAIKKIVLG